MENLHKLESRPLLAFHQRAHRRKKGKTFRPTIQFLSTHRADHPEEVRDLPSFCNDVLASASGVCGWEVHPRVIIIVF
jgi:hypothetical protein